MQHTLFNPMLAQVARGGLRGYLGDFLRLFMAGHLLQQAIITLLFVLPLPLAAASHFMVIAKVATSGGLDACHTQVRLAGRSGQGAEGSWRCLQGARKRVP